MVERTLRIGCLGAARIAPPALTKPARQVAGVEVASIAARDRSRAEQFARKHHVPRVHGSYEELLADPELDAVYNPLPNSLHAEWTIAALKAGKHVLCEKPLANNAEEARAMAQAARESGKVLMEAFHYRYHPLMARVLELVHGGALGTVQRIETSMCIPLPLPSDIRYRWALGGGATMDVGCYAIHMLRTVAAAEPQVTRARAKLSSPLVDRATEAEFTFDDGRTGRIQCSLFSSRLLKLGMRVIGDEGELRVLNATVPHLFNRLTLVGRQGRVRERVDGEATYTCQLRAFRGAVIDGDPILTPPTDSILNMQVIDAVYAAAGLPPRGVD